MLEALTRRRLLRAALGGLTALGVLPSAVVAKGSRTPKLAGLTVRGATRRFAGDRPLFVTVAPGVEGRDVARVAFELERKARVRLDAVRTGINRSDVRWSRAVTLAGGSHSLPWRPTADTPVGSYVMRVTVEGEGGRRVYGGRRPVTPDRANAPVVRVLGIEAAFTQRSYLPEERMALRVLADTPSFALTFLRVGHGPDPSQRSDEMTGLPMADPIAIDWTGKRSTRRTIVVQSGEWPSGLYAAKLETEDGRVGFAPFVLRPTDPGDERVAVVLPTNTWQAYNLYDSDGDGWGDTWYAGGKPPVVLDRPYRDRGVPPRFFRYDFPFLRWLEKTRRNAAFFADDDLESFATGDDLRRLYDLVVFPGHSEYMTQHAYDVVERFRDLGGRLVFLSANNFFWKVEKRGQSLRRVAQWRALSRPEARLCGVQYRMNDDGTRQGPFFVPDVSVAPWLFEDTGLEDGDTLGEEVGGFGIEIDTTTPLSPPGTKVLAVIPNLFGPGLHAEMAYYETEAGARVFSAGVLDFPAVLLHPVGFQLMDNLWRHMLAMPDEEAEPDE
ncbi:MAG TPA: N,N-dimethylformamidase beta subunit family domain-containing protein [Gaiella sp.]|nr:N,N-dimethylformamidase beta subunit family domain-containing protein [Gaiella sp.]